MSWCKACGRYHLYGPCTTTFKNEADAWQRLRALLTMLAKAARS